MPSVKQAASTSPHRACYYVSSAEEIEAILSEKVAKAPALVVDSRQEALQIQIKGCEVVQLK